MALERDELTAVKDSGISEILAQFAALLPMNGLFERCRKEDVRRNPEN